MIGKPGSCCDRSGRGHRQEYMRSAAWPNCSQSVPHRRHLPHVRHGGLNATLPSRLLDCHDSTTVTPQRADESMYRDSLLDISSASSIPLYHQRQPEDSFHVIDLSVLGPCSQVSTASGQRSPLTIDVLISMLAVSSITDRRPMVVGGVELEPQNQTGGKSRRRLRC